MKPTHRLLSRLTRQSGLAALVSCALAGSHLLAAGVPAFIDYQGKVLDGNGAPLAATAPGNFEIEFRIWDAATGGTIIWAEKQLVTVSNGMFSVRLGEGQAILGNGAADIGTVPHDSVGLTGAFEGKDRFLGLTVKIPGQTPGEIVPRLSFLSAPYALKAASAAALVQAPGTTSNLTVGSIAYSTATVSSSLALGGDTRTVLVNSTAGDVTATLPLDGAKKEILVAKKDDTLNQVLVAPPAGGTLNGGTSPVRLKVRGESVTIQNIEGNDWWVVDENRDKTPVGTIVAFGGNGAAPAGYLVCDGASLSRTAHPELFAAIGSQWGTANASSFNLPNLEGRFLRGTGVSGNGADDDATTRFALTAGGATGRNVGTYQNEAFKSHNHGVSDPGHGHNVSAPQIYFRNFVTGSGGRGFNPDVRDGETNQGVYNTTANSSTTGISITANGSNETRPDNAGVRYCIKY